MKKLSVVRKIGWIVRFSAALCAATAAGVGCGDNGEDGEDGEEAPEQRVWQCHYANLSHETCICQYDDPDTRWTEAADTCALGPGRTTCCLGFVGDDPRCECFEFPDCNIAGLVLTPVSSCHDLVVPDPNQTQ